MAIFRAIFLAGAAILMFRTVAAAPVPTDRVSRIEIARDASSTILYERAVSHARALERNIEGSAAASKAEDEWKEVVKVPGHFELAQAEIYISQTGRTHCDETAKLHKHVLETHKVMKEAESGSVEDYQHTERYQAAKALAPDAKKSHDKAARIRDAANASAAIARRILATHRGHS